MPNQVIHRILTILIGAGLYTVLCFIPIFGPLIAGFHVGKRMEYVKGSSLVALISAFLGFLFLSFLVFPGVYGNTLHGIAYMFWQTISTITMMLGAALSSMLQGIWNMSDLFNYQRVNAAVKPDERIRKTPSYVVCPACGESNENNVAKCKACNAVI